MSPSPGSKGAVPAERLPQPRLPCFTLTHSHSKGANAGQSHPAPPRREQPSPAQPPLAASAEGKTEARREEGAMGPAEPRPGRLAPRHCFCAWALNRGCRDSQHLPRGWAGGAGRSGRGRPGNAEDTAGGQAGLVWRGWAARGNGRRQGGNTLSLWSGSF